MKHRYLYSLILAFLLLTFFRSNVSAAENPPKPNLFIKIELPSEGYVGQALTYDLFLYSSSADIADVKVTRQADFYGLTVTSGQSAARGERVIVKHKEYYRYNIGKYFLRASEAGSYKISGGSYLVYIGHEVVVNDFFFGATRRMQYEKVEVEAPDMKLKIKNLPLKKPENFSGAVGNFEILAWLPPGHINEGKDALAIVKISGDGFLSDAEVPAIKEIFGTDARMKEIRRSDNLTQKDGRLNAEIILECTFVPLNGKGELGDVKFVFFDPEKGKFRTISTESLIWNNDDEYSPVDKSKLKVIDI